MTALILVNSKIRCLVSGCSGTVVESDQYLKSDQ